MSHHNFIKFAGLLKQTQRTGWKRFLPDQRVESVADHSFRMGIITLLFLEDPSINQTKCMQMSLIHDLAESIVGDITPFCGVSIEDKRQREDQAMKEILKDLPLNLQQKLYELWKEYEDLSSNEAILVKDIDKYEMIFQAFQYEQQYGVNLEEFYKSKEKIQNKKIQEWVDELLSKRIIN